MSDEYVGGWKRRFEVEAFPDAKRWIGAKLEGELQRNRSQAFLQKGIHLMNKSERCLLEYRATGIRSDRADNHSGLS